MKLFFKTNHLGLCRAMLRGVSLVQLGDRTFTDDVQPPEIILKVARFPWPSDQIIVQLDACFQRDPLTNELPILLRRSLRSPQCDQILINNLKGYKEVRRNGLNATGQTDNTENRGKRLMHQVKRHAVRYFFFVGILFPTFARAFCISVDTPWLMSWIAFAWVCAAG